MSRSIVILAAFLAAVLALVPASFGHGGDDDEMSENLAKQPARVLVQQAHALLVAGKDGEEIEMRLDAASESKDKSDLDMARVDAGHEAFEAGDRERAIRLLEEALAAEPAAGAGEEAEGSGESGMPGMTEAPPLDSEKARKRIHGEERVFHPGHGAQEVAGGVVGAVLLALVAGGLLLCRRRDAAAAA